MGTSHNGLSTEQAPDERGQEESSEANDLVKRLDLPDEVTTQEAAAILGCCKHTILQYLVEGLVEWRNVAPPSSQRPVYRLTLRSVLELRLAYQRGSPHPLRLVKPTKARRRSVPSSDFRPKHLRRKKPPVQDSH